MSLAVQPNYCNLLMPAERLGKYPKVLLTIFNTDLAAADLVVINQECQRSFDTYKVTQEQIDNLEEDTRKQSNSKLWFSHRAGRVTSSTLKQCLTTIVNKTNNFAIAKS